MVKKKVIDADIMLEKIQQMTYRDFAVTPYTSQQYYGDDMEIALRNLNNQINIKVAEAIRQSLQIMLLELTHSIRESVRDEDGGMCGLCRVDPEQHLPMDYRPVKP